MAPVDSQLHVLSIEGFTMVAFSPLLLSFQIEPHRHRRSGPWR